MEPSSHQPVIDFSGTKPGEAVLKLLVQGFTQSERQLLDAIIHLSQRRLPRIELLAVSDGESADVVMIDAADAQAKKWASSQHWLERKAVIWVDAPAATGRTTVRRPIHWSALPVLLAKWLEQAPGNMPGAAAVTSESNSVLVVDDSMAVRMQLRALLEARGLTVADVDSAEAAFKAATASHYACILMDVLMPGMDGYDACRHIKANTSGGNRPTVVMLTSKSSPFDRIRGKMAGCDAYLTKPIDTEHLFEVVSRYTAKPANSSSIKQRIVPPQYA
jgi:two-component system cell cycle response regulator